MIRLLPSTLSGRLIVTLLAGLLAAQVLAAVILLRDRAAALYEASGLSGAQRVAELVQMFDRLDDSARAEVLPVLTGEPLQVQLLEQRPASLPREGRRNALLRATVERIVGKQPVIEVAMLRHDGASLAEGSVGWSDGLGHERGAMVVAQALLADGNWLRIEHRLGSQPFPWPLRLLLTLLVLLGSVIALTLLVVRWLTRPLGILATAAVELGRDIQRPPLPEVGTVEVCRAAAAFNTMQARLRAYLQERERALAAISHDLRTPITRLRLRVELIEDEVLRSKMDADLADMEAMTASALEQLRGAHSDEPRRPLDIMALLDSMQADAEEAGQDVAVHGKASAPYRARPLALKRLLANLVDNALGYGRSACITVTDDPDGLRIVVADDGPGIPEDQLESVFEPFYRIEGSRSRKTGGVGLGLSVARDIARGHGGDLVLRNRQPFGLEAILRLPRCEQTEHL